MWNIGTKLKEWQMAYGKLEFTPINTATNGGVYPVGVLLKNGTTG